MWRPQYLPRGNWRHRLHKEGVIRGTFEIIKTNPIDRTMINDNGLGGFIGDRRSAIGAKSPFATPLPASSTRDPIDMSHMRQITSVSELPLIRRPNTMHTLAKCRTHQKLSGLWLHQIVPMGSAGPTAIEPPALCASDRQADPESSGATLPAELHRSYDVPRYAGK